MGQCILYASNTLRLNYAKLVKGNYTPNQKLARFALYLKIFENFRAK